MSAAAKPPLTQGRVYRTKDFARWSGNPARLAKRLVRDGALVKLGHGLFAHPKRSRFGPVPPTELELMRAFLDDTAFVFTGPERWNALGLGTTAMFVAALVYNTKRSGTFTLGGTSFRLRRVAFPDPATPEWFIVDLLEHAEDAGAARHELAAALSRAVRQGAFRADRLRKMAEGYGTKATRKLVESAISGAHEVRPRGP